jgi:hypothetical protein
MANVKIDITVDTVKLLAKFPKGGEITDHSIIVMTDSNKAPAYQNAFQDKLITSAKAGDKINWKIKSKDGGTNLDFTDYKGDSNMLNVFAAKPAINSQDKTDCNGEVKGSMPQATVSTDYTFSFCVKKNPSVFWSWDPNIIVPFPPK